MKGISRGLLPGVNSSTGCTRQRLVYHLVCHCVYRSACNTCSNFCIPLHNNNINRPSTLLAQECDSFNANDVTLPHSHCHKCRRDGILVQPTHNSSAFKHIDISSSQKNSGTRYIRLFPTFFDLITHNTDIPLIASQTHVIGHISTKST